MEPEINVRIIPFSAEACPFDKAGQHTWREWHTFRNLVLDILSQYGTIGPLGKMPILDTYEESKDAWPLATSTPDFFVVDDDMYGNSVRIEGRCQFVKPVLLQELLMLLAQRHAYSVYLALGKGGLWLFHDRILLEGDLSTICHSMEDIYRYCASEGSAPEAPPSGMQ